jgi:hypothetical protein
LNEELQIAMTSFFKASMNKRNKQNSTPSSISPFVNTSYSSNPVEIPADFLKVIGTNAEPISVQRVNFAESALPEYAPYYATVLDNVLSASECAELLRLAVLSSPTGNWAPALLNAGIGVEFLDTKIRNCDRYPIPTRPYPHTMLITFTNS